MTIPITGSGTTASGSTNPTPTLSNNQLDSSAFLQLLMTEMQNQDPTQPMDDTQMITQLAQINQTQNSQQMVTTQQETFAASVLGQTVTGTETGATVTGMATAVSVDGSTVNVLVNGQPMNVSSIIQVAPTAPATTAPTANPPSTTSSDGGANA